MTAKEFLENRINELQARLACNKEDYVNAVKYTERCKECVDDDSKLIEELTKLIELVKGEQIMWKTYKEMNDWEKMECRLGRYMISKIENGKIYYRIDQFYY